jgi:hypothetical protein
MRERSPAPQWREPPQRRGPISEMDELVAASQRIEDLCVVGCGFGLAVTLVAAAVVWADPAIAWIAGWL